METAVSKRKLTLQDRCDSCQAAAKVVAEFLNGELMFCGHHARAAHESLKLKAISILDPENEMSQLDN
jgi:hypothetical protein